MRDLEWGRYSFMVSWAIRLLFSPLGELIGEAIEDPPGPPPLRAPPDNVNPLCGDSPLALERLVEHLRYPTMRRLEAADSNITCFPPSPTIPCSITAAKNHTLARACRGILITPFVSRIDEQGNTGPPRLLRLRLRLY